jgi:phenol 2-monooxygenase (NADPH)
MLEVCFWNPDSEGQIQRNGRTPDTIPNLSRFTEVVLHQGRMEQFFLDAIRASYTEDEVPLRVERGVVPVSLTIEESEAEDEDAYPVTVTLRRLSDKEATPAQRLSNLADGLFRSNLVEDDEQDLSVTRSEAKSGVEKEEVVRAKYVVGCDGAHSWTRKALGEEFEMQGEMSDFIWYAMFQSPRPKPALAERALIEIAVGASWTSFLSQTSVS